MIKKKRVSKKNSGVLKSRIKFFAAL